MHALAQDVSAVQTCFHLHSQESTPAIVHVFVLTIRWRSRGNVSQVGANTHIAESDVERKPIGKDSLRMTRPPLSITSSTTPKHPENSTDVSVSKAKRQILSPYPGQSAVNGLVIRLWKLHKELTEIQGHYHDAEDANFFRRHVLPKPTVQNLAIRTQDRTDIIDSGASVLMMALSSPNLHSIMKLVRHRDQKLIHWHEMDQHLGSSPAAVLNIT